MVLAAAPTTIGPRIRCRFSFFSPRKPLPLPTTTVKKFSSSPPPPFLLLSGHRALKLSPLKASSSSFNGFAHPQNIGTKTGNFDAESSETGFRERLVSGLVILRSFLPGGSWWNLELEEEEGRGGEEAKSDRKKGVSVIGALRRMWMLVANDRWVIFLAFTCLMIAALSEISIPHFLAASIFSAQSGESMIFYRNARLLVLLCFASGICSGLRSCCFGIANMILVRRMREKLYDALLLQDISFFDEETVGDLTSRLGADCQQVSRVFGTDLNMIARNVVQGTGALIYLFILSWPLALSTLVICSALATIMLIHGQYQKKAAKLSQELTACANEVAQETFSLVRTVRAYGMEKHEFGRYIKWLGLLSNVYLRQSMAFGFWSSSFNFLYHSTQVIAVLIGGISIISGRITAEQLTKFILYSEWLIYSTWWVGDNWSSLMQSIGASEKVFLLMDLLPSNQFLSPGRRLQKLEGHVDFVNISFRYPSRLMVPVLRQVSLSVHPNEVVAIAGLSGSGKSTLVNLLLRLYEPTDGQILVDGVPLVELDIKWLRERIGFVGQEPRLFRMDVSSNIKYGCPREVTDEEVEWAAKQANAHEFILSLPNGYGTLVDDSLLSGGQKQRIAIARAILREPNILILDEATSALDAESEHYVKRVLRLVQNGSNLRRTVIIIAHRLSTIQAADRIIVMDRGRIVEMGDHMELIQKDGLYARLAKRQTDAFA
ncbi:ABC transporter B family member 26, chloroplastic isoform X1 [Phoenix dactylifera]|uniref:ABC transporter B family member 26, chloroplastic isoform X1 n=1 Tax=Phoenix dactylifera TaxID=42345 RepID=A0A8B7CW79_PHODC|nr:ABC transporter B family member 26, chloroplastic isoform X1 [Phoenix dactylifera]